MDNLKTWPEKIYLQADGKIDLTTRKQDQSNSVVIFGADHMPKSVLYIRVDFLALPTVEEIAKTIFETEPNFFGLWEDRAENDDKERTRDEARAVLALLEKEFRKEREENESLRAKIAELESNERAYEQIIGPKSYQEVATEIAELRKDAEKWKSSFPSIKEICEWQDAVNNDDGDKRGLAHELYKAEKNLIEHLRVIAAEKNQAK